MHGVRPLGRECERRAMKGIFTAFFLWLLSRKGMHGYEIIRTVGEDGGFPGATASRIYPMLAELEHSGLVAQRKEMHGRRARKVYSLTAKGREVLERAKKHIAESPLKQRYLRDMLRP